MKQNRKTAALLAASLVLVAAIILLILKAAGGHLDVVGKDSAAAFDKMLGAIPGQVTTDETGAGWSLEAPDKSARFIWGAGGSAPYDVMLAVDATPFVRAGLDTAKLPESYTVDADMLLIGTRLGGGDPAAQDASTPLEAYARIVDDHRSAIGYHTALDHYNISLGSGNLFEWAKNMRTNSVTKEKQDKDIVFVLNPAPLIAAGADPENVEGWVYAAVNVEIDGKPASVYKLLKPFDLQ